jgi:hypothetical protein
VPLEDRRRVHRRVAQRRSGSIALNGTERRQGRDRRVRERRETVGEHLRNGLQVLLHCTTGREVAAEVRYDIAAAARRVWLALQELERGKPVVERLDG